MTSLKTATGAEDVRGSILTASIDLMNEGGLAALSMREVARRAGVSHQAPYHYFADREAILAELVRDGFEKLTGYLEDSLRHVRGYDESIGAMGEAYVAFALDHSAQFRLMFRSEMVDSTRHPETHAAGERTFDLCVKIVTGAERHDDCKDFTPVIAAWSTAHGLATLFLEGKLTHSVGDTRAERLKAARAVFQHYMPRPKR
ncbi:MAG TPA: TetR/AcrR family transcriptional regulator [Hyphomonadaceae bacterium]|nr:TetR/AcrR family transcriptional regulator [Hyphomonadaceae bacterium]